MNVLSIRKHGSCGPFLSKIEGTVDLVQSFQSFAHELLDTETRVVLAVSGGLDSCVLLDLFARLVPKDRLVVAHYHHGIRADADADAAFVEERSRALGIECRLGHRIAGGPSDEASLRDDRRAFLESVRRQWRGDSIATAHHLNDQLETFLMRILRGTGLEGLGVMSHERGTYLKPLLGYSRRTLENHARKYGVEFRQDASNADPRYLRNRVRTDLVPAFEALSAEYGGMDAFLERLGELTEELRETESVLQDHTRALNSHLFAHTPFWSRGDLLVFHSLPLFWKSRVLRRALETLGVATLDRDDCRRLIAFLQSSSPAVSLPGVSVTRSCGYFYLQTPEQAQRANAPRAISTRGSSVSVPELDLKIDFPKAEQAGQWRFFEPGDQFEGQKLKEWFLAHRIPRPERSLLPLLVRPGQKEVIWCFPQAYPGLKIECAEFPFAASVRSLNISPGP